MYIEILGFTGAGLVTEVDILIHEGPLHNRRFRVNASVVLALIWKKKITFDTSDIKDMLSKEFPLSVNHSTKGTQDFLNELKKISEG